MQRFCSLLLIVVCLLSAAVAQAGKTPETEDQKILYAVGLALAKRISSLEFTEEELAYVQSGLVDGAVNAKPKVEPEVYGPKIQAFANERIAAASKREAALGAAWATKMAEKAGAVTTESGMVYIETAAGTGASPGPTDKARLHYHGTLRDGSVFDSSVDRDEPAEFPLNGVIKCFSEGLQKMKVGGKSRLICPPDIAYGERGSPPKIQPGATLSFEVELLEVFEQ